MRHFRALATLTILLLLQSILLSHPASSAEEGPFEQLAGAVRRNCSQCHFRNASTINASRRLALDDLVASEQQAIEAAAEWRKVYDRAVINRSMPPPNAGQEMSNDDRAAIRSWIERNFGVPAGETPPINLVRRLTNDEYSNSIRDLFGLDMDVAPFIQHDSVDNGFKNNAAVMFWPPDRVRQYITASRFVSQTVLGLNDAQTFRRRQWTPAEILKKNPNRGLKDRLVRVFAETWNRVKKRQREPDAPNLHIVDIEDAEGHKVDAIDLGRNGRFALKNEFPLSANYTITIRGRAAKARSGAVLRIAIDGQPVPARIEFPASRAVESYLLDVRVPRGHRSIDVSMASSDHALVVAIEVAGPRIPDRPASLSCMTPAAPEPTAMRRCAFQAIHDLASRAFRGPSVDQAEVDALLAPFAKAVAEGKEFRVALSRSVQTVLMSPRFLLRTESARPPTANIDDFEFATRLSYFLWGSMPDEQLRALASQRNLVNVPGEVRAQVKRMLADPRAVDGLAVAFGEGWTGYGNLRTHDVDHNVFPEFDGELRYAMLRETELFLKAFFDENWPITDLIDSKTMFVNERLARHYGIAGVRGPEFRRIESSQAERRGLFTQGSILTITSVPNRTSVVKRGFWFLDRVLCEQIEEPPPGVQGLPDTPPPNQTLREEMAAHRADPLCAGCHDQLDPFGFSLEAYGGIGTWRRLDRGRPIDPSGTLQTKSGPVGFRDFHGLKELLKDDERVPQCVAEKLMTYALGRKLSEADRALASSISAATRTNGYRIHDVITEITLSDAFRGKAQ